MKHIKSQRSFKLKNGFALIEAIVTVTLMATVLTAIYSLQSSMFKTVLRRHGAISRVFHLRNMFFDYPLLDQFKEGPADKELAKETLGDPSMEMTFSAKSIANETYPFLYRLDSVGDWQGMYRPEQEIISGAIFAHMPEDADEETDKKIKKKEEPKKQPAKK